MEDVSAGLGTCLGYCCEKCLESFREVVRPIKLQVRFFNGVVALHIRPDFRLVWLPGVGGPGRERRAKPPSPSGTDGQDETDGRGAGFGGS